MPTNLEKFQLTQRYLPKVNLLVDIKNQVDLKERDTRSCISALTDALQDMARKVDNTRFNNVSKRKDIQVCMKADQTIIHEVLQERPNYLAGLLRAPAGMAIDSLHQRVCHARRRYDEIAHKCRKSIDVLKEIDFQSIKIFKWADKFMDEKQAKRHRKLLNDIDKAKARFEAAMLISNRYETLKNVLRKEQSIMPGRMAELRDLHMVAIKELKEATTQKDIAERLNNSAVKELVRIEASMYEEKKVRDELRRARKDEALSILEIKSEKSERKGKNQWNIDQEEIRRTRAAYQNKIEQQEKRQEQILQLQDVVLRLKNALKASEVDEMLYRASNLNQVGIRLNDRRRSQAIKRDNLKEEMAKLELAIENHNHHSHPIKERSAAAVLKVNDAFKETHKRLLDSDHIRNGRESLVANISTGVNILYEKLRNTDLTKLGMVARPTSETKMGRELWDDFRTVENKLLTLSMLFKTDMPEQVNQQLVDSKMYNHTIANLPGDAIRVTISAESTTDDFHLRTEANNEGYVTREDIKRIGLELIHRKEQKKGPVKQGRR